MVVDPGPMISPCMLTLPCPPPPPARPTGLPRVERLVQQGGARDGGVRRLMTPGHLMSACHLEPDSRGSRVPGWLSSDGSGTLEAGAGPPLPPPAPPPPFAPGDGE